MMALRRLGAVLKAALPLLLLDVITFTSQFVPAGAVATSAADAAQSVTVRVLSLGPWTLAALAVLLVVVAAHAKSVPFAWHFRIFRALYTHRSPPAKSSRVGLLFQPVLTSTGTPLTDCDYNIHKSNSTYFADLDLARVHLLGALGFAAQPKGAPLPALGGVSCNFRRPVGPLQRVKIYTRVLSWDAKWLYIASWIVLDDKKSEKPRVWSLQPWRNAEDRAREGTPSLGEKGAKQPTVCAVSLARYVFKKGRVTVAPGTVLVDAGLLPASPEGDEAAAAAEVARTADENKAQEWTFAAAEQERLKGLEVARGMGSLDGLLDGLRPGEEPALGEW